jgi:PhzF family phenazine biosynthesis protein
MSTSATFYLVDAFATRPFTGNPAAVCLLPSWPEEAWLQNVAREMAKPVTAFLVKTAAGFDLRWLTATGELELCGHGTLASGHVLRDRGDLSGDGEIAFSTRGGVLKAALRGEEIELDFPVKREAPADPPAGLVEALGVAARYVGRNPLDYLVEVGSESVLRQIKPDFERLAALPSRGVIVTSRSSDARYDFVSRFFAPSTGTCEDAVTGSAHCCLADFWGKRLGKTTFLAYQASARGGELRVELRGERVRLGGRAVILARGELN